MPESKPPTKAERVKFFLDAWQQHDEIGKRLPQITWIVRVGGPEFVVKSGLVVEINVRGKELRELVEETLPRIMKHANDMYREITRADMVVSQDFEPVEHEPTEWIPTWRHEMFNMLDDLENWVAEK